MKANQKRVAIYCRVSTQDQKTDMQISDLRRYCQDRGFEIFEEYCDNGVSGSIKKRPALDKLMVDAAKRKFDIVLVWRFDRAARSVQHLVEILHILKNLGIDFISYNEAIDTSSPLGEAIFSIIGAMSQLERDVIRERVKAGLRNAREQGKRLGRPKALVDLEKAKRLQEEGLSLRQISEVMGIPKSTLGRVFNGSGKCPKNPVEIAVLSP